MMPPGHADGVVQTCQIVDTGALQGDEPSKDRVALMTTMVPYADCGRGYR